MPNISEEQLFLIEESLEIAMNLFTIPLNEDLDYVKHRKIEKALWNVQDTIKREVLNKRY